VQFDPVTFLLCLIVNIVMDNKTAVVFNFVLTIVGLLKKEIHLASKNN
jgi:hypothetical protein